MGRNVNYFCSTPSCLSQDCGVGAIYVFTTSLEPSFKMIRDTNQAVGNLSKSPLISDVV